VSELNKEKLKIMKWKRVLIKELDGTERVRLELERRIIRPKFEFKEEFEEEAWEFGVEESILPLLKKEIHNFRKGLRRKDVFYGYGCPYCNFTSEFFHAVDLHIVYSEKCYENSKIKPCYPMNYCIHIPTGKQFIP